MYGIPNSRLLDGAPNELTTGISERPQSGFIENLIAERTNIGLNESAYGIESVMEKKLQERDDLIKQRTGQSFSILYVYPELADALEQGAGQISPSDRAKSRYGRNFIDARTGYINEGAEALLKRAVDQEKRIEELRKQYPDIPSFRDVTKSTQEFLETVRQEAASTSKHSTLLGAAGGFAGGVQGSMTSNDPFNLATLPFGGFGKTVATRIGTEALTQSGISLFNQYALVKEQKQAFGQEFTNEGALLNSLYAGVGGAVVRGLGEAGGAAVRGVQVVPEKARQVAASLDKLAQRDTRLGRIAQRLISAKTPDEAGAALREANPKDISDLLDRVDSSPTSTTAMAKAAAEPEITAAASQPRGMAWPEHIERANQVATALERNQPLPQFDPIPGNSIGRDLPAVRIADVLVDAERFQFKSGGDATGVTERLKGITDWNEEAAGNISVWESADGKRYVADGHQRVGLANRIMAANPDKDIRIPAYIYREADGYTAQDAMVKAAIKNIGQGSGSAIDAARIFKGQSAEDMAAARRILSPNSELVKQGQALMNLDDNGLAMVDQGIVPENYAAIVGRETGDHAKQIAILKILQKADPDNAFQAEQIVRQALAEDIDMNVVTDLFGDRLEAAPLYADKAKVLDLAMKQIRRERGALSNLIRNDEVLANYGNALNIDTTKAGLDATAILQYIVQKQAFSKGTISDLLSTAAREVQNGTRHTSAARQFLDALKRQISENGAGSLLGDASGFASSAKQAISEIAQRERQDLFTQAVKEAPALTEPKAIESRYQELQEELAQDFANINPDESIPLGDFAVDAEGEVTQKLVTMRQLLDDIADDDAMVQSMKECSI